MPYGGLISFSFSCSFSFSFFFSSSFSFFIFSNFSFSIFSYFSRSIFSCCFFNFSLWFKFSFIFSSSSLDNISVSFNSSSLKLSSFFSSSWISFSFFSKIDKLLSPLSFLISTATRTKLSIPLSTKAVSFFGTMYSFSKVKYNRSKFSFKSVLVYVKQFLNSLAVENLKYFWIFDFW